MKFSQDTRTNKNKYFVFKRVLIFLLSLLITPCMLVIPAQADELNDFGWINVLDFSTLNGSGSNIYHLYAGNNSFYYELPNIQSISYVDMIFAGSYDMSHLQVNNGSETNNLTVVHIGGNLYRAFGNIGSQWTGRLDFSFPEVNSDYHITILQLEVTAISVDAYDSHLVGDVVCGINHYNINHGQQSVYMSPYEYDYDFSATLVPYEWYKFDFVKVYINVESYGIHSISVDQNGVPVPFDVSYLGPSSTENQYRVCVTIDIRHLDRLSSNNVDLRVYGRMDSDGAYFSILSVTGFVVIEEPSSLRHWFTTLFDQFGGWFSEQFSLLNNGFNSVVTSVSTWGQNIVDALGANANTDQFNQGVEDAKDKLDSSSSAMNDFTRPNVDNVIPEVNISIDNTTGTLLGSLLSDQTVGTLATGSLAIWLICIILGI